MEDSHIIELYWKRDERAIVRTEEKYGKYCFAVAYRILANMEDSKECVNDTWLHTWKRIPPHKPEVFKMFLAKITRGLSCNRLRERMAAKRGGGKMEEILEELAECLASETDVEEQIVAEELGRTINDFVRQMPVKEGDVFIRRYFFGETFEEIANRYDLTVNNTTVILSRARKKLKEHLKKEGYVYE